MRQLDRHMQCGIEGWEIFVGLVEQTGSELSVVGTEIIDVDDESTSVHPQHATDGICVFIFGQELGEDSLSITEQVVLKDGDVEVVIVVCLAHLGDGMSKAEEDVGGEEMARWPM